VCPAIAHPGVSALVRSLRDGAGAGRGLHRLACETAGWLLSLTALGLFTLYVASNSALAALGVAVTLVPGCLLLSCERSRLAELELRALAWRLTQPW